MAFAQLTYRESLRDIETCLRAHQAKLYHLGIRGNIARSTLADANESRDWHIYADFDNEITAHRLIRNDVLKTLYGSSAKNLEKLLDTAFSLQQQMAQSIGLDKLPELMGLHQGATHTTMANSRLEALRQAVLLYSSMCNMDVLDDASDEDKPIFSDANKRFFTEVREHTAMTHPTYLNYFNRQSPLFSGGEPVKFGFLSEKSIVHFSVLHPIRQQQSVSAARAKLWELSGASDYIGINAAMIMAVPRFDDATLGSNQTDSAKRNMSEIEKEADKRDMRLYCVNTASHGANKLIELAS